MTAFTAMALMMATGTMPASNIDFDLAAQAERMEALSTIRLTHGAPKPTRSRYLAPELTDIEDGGNDEDPPKLRWRGRKIKLRVPVGPGS